MLIKLIFCSLGDVFIIFPEVTQKIGRIHGGAIGTLCHIAQLVARFHPRDPSGAICIGVAISPVDRISVVGKANERRMLRAVNGVESVGIVQVADGGNDIQVEFEGRWILMVMVVSHGWMALAAIKACHLCGYGVPVPIHRCPRSTRTGRIARASAECIGTRIPRNPIAIIEQGHPIDEDANIATRCRTGCSCFWNRIQRNLINGRLILGLGGIAIEKGAGRIRWDTRTSDVGIVVGISHLLAVDQKTIVNGRAVALHVVTAC
ncbi:MAG: Uncharacterised protein [Flavobacteriia bacterium]|nr:MAG: Uncharacterised protein [Flavobacteriia bacterium]